MSKVKRYELVSEVGYPHPEEYPDAPWVKWEDYAKLEAKAQRLAIEVQRLTTALRTCDLIIKPLRDKAQRKSE